MTGAGRLIGLVLLALIFGSPPARGQAVTPVPPYRITAVRSPDGVMLQAYEWGDPKGPPIVFIHGIYQSALSWTKQVADPRLASRYHLVAFDLRGHGASDKPDGAAYYRDGQRWAGDLAAVIDSLRLERPVVVAWSYGGRVLNDYLAVNGDSRLAGLVYVAARSVTGPPTPNDPRRAKASRDALSADPATFILGTREFVQLCFHTLPPPADVDLLTAASMQTPLYVRKALVGRSVDYGPVLAKITVPTLIIQGDRDAVVSPEIAVLTQAAIPGSRLSIYPGVGHSSFWESPARFDAELDAFAARANAAAPKP